jgi:hypothetical protein
MRISKTYILTITLTFIFITVGFFLPEWMTAFTDKNIIGKVESESFELPKALSGNSISMIKRISLLQDYPQNVDRVALDMGTNFDLTSASDRFFEEITELAKLDLLPETDPEGKGTIKMDVSLYVKKNDPSVSGIFWSIALQKDGFLGNFYMDDYTGKIIQFIVTTQDKPLLTEKKAIEAWAEYLGLEVQNIESQPNAYSFWEDETTKIFQGGYNVYNLELKLKNHILSYTFYTFENGYGFGYIMKFISNYNTQIQIRP